MSSSDIYQVKESPWAKQQKSPPKRSRHRRQSSVKSFDETVNKDLSQTHRRRHRNSGFRRFRHQMKKPEYSKKFWLITLSVGGSILALLLIWDAFFRYPNDLEQTAEPTVYRIEVE